jgi:DNA-binding NarL/FixJ family response regulator
VLPRRRVVVRANGQLPYRLAAVVDGVPASIDSVRVRLRPPRSAYRAEARTIVGDVGPRGRTCLSCPEVLSGRVVIADDEVLLREGLSSLLASEGFEVVGQAGDPSTLLAAVRDASPDLAIVDIRMPPTHTTEGIDAARTIRAEFPDVGLLLLSAHVEVETALDLLQGGTRVGYLLKSRVTRVEDLLEAIERISAGGSVVDPALVEELFRQRRRVDPLADLSPKEREVLALMAEGRSNAGIAQRLWVTEGTVEKHVRSILAKLKLPGSEDDHRRVLAVLTFLDAS